jgi:hypothetical protein
LDGSLAALGRRFIFAFAACKKITPPGTVREGVTSCARRRSDIENNLRAMSLQWMCQEFGR